MRRNPGKPSVVRVVVGARHDGFYNVEIIDANMALPTLTNPGWKRFHPIRLEARPSDRLAPL
jgi:hypothetical protein